jgi:hypothetical protein
MAHLKIFNLLLSLLKHFKQLISRQSTLCLVLISKQLACINLYCLIKCLHCRCLNTCVTHLSLLTLLLVSFFFSHFGDGFGQLFFFILCSFKLRLHAEYEVFLTPITRLQLPNLLSKSEGRVFLCLELSFHGIDLGKRILRDFFTELPYLLLTKCFMMRLKLLGDSGKVCLVFFPEMSDLFNHLVSLGFTTVSVFLLKSFES